MRSGNRVSLNSSLVIIEIQRYIYRVSDIDRITSRVMVKDFSRRFRLLYLYTRSDTVNIRLPVYVYVDNIAEKKNIDMVQFSHGKKYLTEEIACELLACINSRIVSGIHFRPFYFIRSMQRVE